MGIAGRRLDEPKRPAYVTVYDKLYVFLTDGSTFPVGSRLPSEPKLAAMLGVSRMTLRQALSLLHEDGLLVKIHGKGNYVIDQSKPLMSTLERLGHPVYKASRLAIDEVEMEFRIEPPSEHAQQLFKRPTAVAIAVDRWYRSQGSMVAFTFSFLPTETITKMGVDLNYKEQLREMVEKTIYDHAVRTHIVVQPTFVGNFISAKHIISEQENVILMTEDIYGEDDYAPLMCNKHYLLPQHCSIEISATK